MDNRNTIYFSEAQAAYRKFLKSSRGILGLNFKKQEKANEITEDELKSSLDSVQKKVDKAVKDIDAIIEEKNKEVMAV